MPAWLSPRVRLGVTASLIVLIACAIVLTPYLFHEDDAEAPGTLASEIASVDLPTSQAPEMRRSLKHPLVMPVAFSPSQPLSWQTILDTSGSDGEPGPSPSTSPEPEIDWLGQNPLVSQGIVWPAVDCGDCGPAPRNGFQVTHPLFIELGTAGAPGGGGGGAPGPTAFPSVTITDYEPPPMPGNGPGDQGANTQSNPPDDGDPKPPGQPIGPTGPNDPNAPNGPRDPNGPTEPDPTRPDVVQVPEPTSFVIAGMGALSFMIRARLARQRRG
jgi:hypothetical protein